MLRNPSLNVRQFSEECGVSKTTLYTWLKSYQLEPPITKKSPNPEQWSGERKLRVLIETATLNEQELSVYCREHGLYAEQINSGKAMLFQLMITCLIVIRVS